MPPNEGVLCCKFSSHNSNFYLKMSHKISFLKVIFFHHSFKFAMQKHFFLLLFVLFYSSAFAQDFRLSVDKGFEDNKVLSQKFEHYSVVEMNTDDIVKHFRSGTNDLQLSVELENFGAVALSLTPSDILSPELEITDVFPMKGKTNEGGEVALTFAKDMILGLFEVKGNTFYIEPVWYFDKTQPRNLFVLYNSSDVLPSEGIHDCSLVEEIAHQHNQTQSSLDPSLLDCSEPEVTIAIANDFQMVTAFQGASGVIANNIAVINASQANFDNEFIKPLTFNIVAIFVPSSAATDPFPTVSDRNTLLFGFQSWGENGGFGSVAYDIAHWRSPRNIFNPGGQQINGAALQPGLGQPSICTPGRYAIFSQRTNMSACEIKRVTSHETGHLFGADHVPSSPATIMSAPATIPCTDNWAAASIATINATISNSQCLGPSLPLARLSLCINNAIGTNEIIIRIIGSGAGSVLGWTLNEALACNGSVSPQNRGALVPINWIVPGTSFTVPLNSGCYILTYNSSSSGCPNRYFINSANSILLPVCIEEPIEERSSNPKNITGKTLSFSNPSSGTVYFSRSVAQGIATIHSTQGSFVKSFILNDTNQLDISDVPDGPYILTLKSEDEVLSKILIVHQLD